MNTCYRTLCYGTAIQNILRGSFFKQDNLDLVLVKNYSLQYMRIQTDHSTDENDNDILQPIFEQQAFGSILDAKVLPCAFQRLERSDTTLHEHVNTKAIPNYDNKADSPEKQLAYTQKTRIGHTEIQGNDMIAAISEYGQLVFCTVVGRHSELATTGRFECVTEITLDDSGLEYTKVNKKLAIDPWSRAIAIASYQDRIDIMILNDSMSRTQFSPVIGMGSIIEEGIIWHMEFLHTPTNSRDRIILATIVYNDISRLCRIILFSIDASDSQKASIKVIGRLPLEFKTPLPILLFPLQCYQESFMVITERTVCVLSADDISCGNVLYPVIPISSNDFDFNTNEDILITSYSLCADPTLPYMYLGTAEGYLLKLDISDLDFMRWIPCQKVNPIGQQMCVLGLIQVDDDEGELWMAEALLYIGESADSQLIAIPWNDGNSCSTSAPFVLQTLVNRSPLTDWQAVRKNGQPDKLVTCSGQDEQGALHYISRDVDSTTLFTSDVNWNGITKMWCLSNSPDRCHLVASSSYSTRVALLDYEDRMDEDTTEIVETQGPSIFAGSFKVHLHGTVVIQMTQSETILLDMDGVLLLRCPNLNGFTIVTGTSWLTDDILHIFTCISNGQGHALQIVTVSFAEGFSNITTTLGSLITLDHLPSCLYHFTMMDQADGKFHEIVAIGTYNSKVSLYSIVTQDSLKLGQEIDCQDIPHSLATIKTSGQLHLLIGTRSGNLAAINLLSAFDQQYPNQVLTTDNYWVQSLGSSPVVLSVGQNDDLAFALCECIWLLDYDCNSRLMIEAIYKQKAAHIEALLSLDLSYDQQQPSDCQKLAIVADQRLHIIQVKRKTQMMTRKHILATTPRKLLLHDHSTSYLVTSSKHRGKTYHRLMLLDQNGDLLCEHRFAYGETVLSLSKWQVQNKTKVYHYICVGIEHQDNTQNHSNRSPHDTPHGNGSLHLYRLKALKTTGKDSHIQYSIRLVWKNEGLSGGVHTICPHPSGLLFSSGSTLHLHHLDMAQGALVEITHKVLRFPITSIHVVGDRICVTGHVESVSFYSYDKDTMHLSFLKSDSISRNVHHSLLLNNRTVVGVSLSGGMFALKEPVAAAAYDDESLQTLFCFHYPDIIINPHCMSLHSYHSTEYTSGILANHLIPWTTIDESHGNIEHDDATPTLAAGYTISNENHILQQKPQPQHNIATTQPIIGCTISGGVIAVYQCSGTLFTLLNSLQRQLLLYSPTQPLLGSPSRYSQWYIHLSGPEVSTIHCDFISLFIRLTSEQQHQVVRLVDDTAKGMVSGEGDKDVDCDAIASGNSGMDHNDSDNKETMNSPVGSGSLIDLTLAMVEKDDRRSFHIIPDWTPPPDHGNYDNLVSWTARTLALLVTNLERYYF